MLNINTTHVKILKNAGILKSLNFCVRANGGGTTSDSSKFIYLSVKSFIGEEVMETA